MRAVQSSVVEHRKSSQNEVREIGERIGIEWDTSRFDVEQFRIGLDVELEHVGRDPATNVSDDDDITTEKVAWAHLRISRLLHAAGADGSRGARYWDEHGRG